LNGNLPNSDRRGWSMGLLARWTNIARSPRTVEDQRCERSSTNYIEFHASENRCSGPAVRDATSIQPLSGVGDLQRVVQAGLLTEAE
jgi:hypothetical protein